MPSVTASVDVAAPPALVYQYLRGRYERHLHRSAWLATKGYELTITCLEAEPHRRLVFQCPAREPLLGLFAGGWKWGYGIEPVGHSASRVTVVYAWSWVMSLLGFGTVRAQACNEICETALALDALEVHGGERSNAADSQ